MTVKELLKEISKEKYDQKSAQVYITVQGQRFKLSGANIYDNEVHLQVGEAVEDEVVIDSQGNGDLGQ